MHHKHYTGDLTIDKLPDVSGYDKDGNFVLVIREGDMSGDIQGRRHRSQEGQRHR